MIFSNKIILKEKISYSISISSFLSRGIIFFNFKKIIYVGSWVLNFSFYQIPLEIIIIIVIK